MLAQPLDAVKHAVRALPGRHDGKPQGAKLGNGFGLGAIAGNDPLAAEGHQTLRQIQIGKAPFIQFIQDIHPPRLPVIAQQHKPAWIGSKTEIQAHPGFSRRFRSQFLHTPVGENHRAFCAPIAQGVHLIKIGIPFIFQGQAIIHGEETIILIGGFKDRDGVRFAIRPSFPPCGKEFPVKPMGFIHRIEGKGKTFRVRTDAAETFIQLLEIGVRAFGSFLHPDIREAAGGGSEGLDLFHIIQTGKDNLRAVIAGSDGVFRFIDAEKRRKTQPGNGLYRFIPAGPPERSGYPANDQDIAAPKGIQHAAGSKEDRLAAAGAAEIQLVAVLIFQMGTVDAVDRLP